MFTCVHHSLPQEAKAGIRKHAHQIKVLLKYEDSQMAHPTCLILANCQQQTRTTKNNKKKGPSTSRAPRGPPHGLILVTACRCLQFFVPCPSSLPRRSVAPSSLISPSCSLHIPLISLLSFPSLFSFLSLRSFFHGAWGARKVPFECSRGTPQTLKPTIAHLLNREPSATRSRT